MKKKNIWPNVWWNNQGAHKLAPKKNIWRDSWETKGEPRNNTGKEVHEGEAREEETWSSWEQLQNLVLISFPSLVHVCPMHERFFFLETEDMGAVAFYINKKKCMSVK